MIILVIAVFGGRGAGQPKRWSKKKLHHLRESVNEIRSNDPDGTTELKCCEILKKRKAERGRYDHLKATTLLRILQKAKTLDEDNRVPTVSEVEQVAETLA